jgi:carbamoyl-phosphate synthase large subunit
MHKAFRVLITGAGTTTAVSVLKGLRAAKNEPIHVIMGDMNRQCAGAYLGDEYVKMPPAKSPDFEKEIVRLCQERCIDLVIPIIDYEFPGWSRVAGGLAEQGTKVVISPAKALARCMEKDKTDAYFRELAIPTIPTWRTADVADPALLPYPLHLKPRCGRASMDNFRIHDVAEYRSACAKVDDAIVQPLIQGTEVTIDTLSNLEGRFLAASPRVRLEVKSGQAYRSRTIKAPELVEAARRIVEGLPIHGPANIQCFLTDDGPRFFEINARFGAGTILSIHAGMNGPLALANMARGRPVPDLSPRPRVLMMRYWQEVFAG